MKNNKPYSKAKKGGILVVCVFMDLVIFMLSLVKIAGDLAIELFTKLLTFSIIAAPIAFLIKGTIGPTITILFTALEVFITLLFFVVLILFVLTTSSDMKKAKLICKTLYKGGFAELIPIVNILPLWTLAAMRIFRNKDI